MSTSLSRRHGDDDLEFARQVVGAVDRLLFRLGRPALVDHLLAVEPDLVIGAGLRQQVLADVDGEIVGGGVRLRQERVGGRHDVAVDVAAGGERVEQRGVDRLHRALQVRLDDAVELERLRASSGAACRWRRSPAMSSSASHCLGVVTPPGRRTRIMKLKAFSSFFLARSRRTSRSSCR